MALLQVKLNIDRSGVGQDTVVWGPFGIDTVLDPEDLAADLADAWATAYTDWAYTAYFPADHFFTSLELYPAAGGAAVGVAPFTPALELGTDDPGPAEVSMVVSHNVETLRGIRPRGRTFVGPFGATAMAARPPEGFRTDTGRVWTEFHAAVVALGPTPVVISRELDGAPRVAPVGLPIVSYAIDDAWDTQRSRGWAATARTTYTPS